MCVANLRPAAHDIKVRTCIPGLAARTVGGRRHAARQGISQYLTMSQLIPKSEGYQESPISVDPGFGSLDKAPALASSDRAPIPRFQGFPDPARVLPLPFRFKPPLGAVTWPSSCLAVLPRRHVDLVTRAEAVLAERWESVACGRRSPVSGTHA